MPSNVGILTFISRITEFHALFSILRLTIYGKSISDLEFGNNLGNIQPCDIGAYYVKYCFNCACAPILKVRASDIFQDWLAEVTHGAKNGGSFSEMMGPKHIKLNITTVDIFL